MGRARNALPRPPLLLITDRTQARQPLERIAAAAFAAGCRWLLLREKSLPPGERLALTRALLAVARAHGATLLVSGDLEAAALADGVQLQRDGDIAAARARLGPSAIIGFSAHDSRAVEDAAIAGADYVTVSPVFPSASKPGYGPALAVAGLRDLAKAASIMGEAMPVLALGGIGAANAGDCLSAGAAGVAVMGEAMRSDNPGAVVASLLRSLAAGPLVKGPAAASVKRRA